MRKIYVAMILCGLSSFAFAEGSQPQTDLNLDASNVFKSKERTDESTLLREISKKQMLLEIKKLEKEIEKLDKPDPSESKSTGPEANGPTIIGANGPSIAAPAPVAPIAPIAPAPVVEKSPIVLYSVNGLGDRLQAKVGIGNRGGYVVSAGDTLPDGSYLIKVTENYIEVSKNKKAKRGEKVYVTGVPAPVEIVGAGAPAMPNAGASSVLSIAPPAGVPGSNGPTVLGSASAPPAAPTLSTAPAGSPAPQQQMTATVSVPQPTSMPTGNGFMSVIK